MHQVKIFSGHEGQTQTLEREVNDWLAASKAKVLQIFGNMAAPAVLAGESGRMIPGAVSSGTRRFAESDIMLVVLYEA